MMHLVAFAQSVLTSGTLQSITPVPDPTVTIQGAQLLVPATYSNVVAAGSLVKATALKQAQLQAPSLRTMFFPNIAPNIIGTTFEGVPNIYEIPTSPLPLVPTEGLEFFSDGGGNGTTAQDVYGLVLLADGPLTPQSGKIYTIQATASVTLAARTWVNGPLTFNQVLPVGTYDIVGMRAQGTGLVAARLVFIGSSAATRAGVPGVADAQGLKMPMFVQGGAGVFGTFLSTTPPSVDCLGDTGTAQTFLFDLIKRS